MAFDSHKLSPAAAFILEAARTFETPFFVRHADGRFSVILGDVPDGPDFTEDELKDAISDLQNLRLIMEITTGTFRVTDRGRLAR
ncbi:hypothetical protein [Planctomyces sp. SH-PL14]|uniref:hypothetical protein n=1 Tax=Planctomyces sp. SH-PL14 TaxID=1632864 RepID=UPI00078C0CAA|nr:hypothetical protein [Planctomyces sp. SH-PL14]AMV18239.1 hypothetical protein VT03_10145 [Planctomyces sp. SH-PL14]